jgi:hypothetical protein
MFEAEKNLKGRRIASFRLPVADWEVAMRALLVFWLLFSWILYRYYHREIGPTFFVAIPALFIANRQIGSYEKGISLPRAAGTVFLTREQILNMKLDGDRLCVIGPDASWKGPYSGGVFPIRQEDLPKFQEVLAQFDTSILSKR